MRVNFGMVMLGLFILGLAVGTMEINSNRFSMPFGIALAVLGIGILFFAEEERQNLVWIKRQVKHLIWKYWPIGS